MRMCSGCGMVLAGWWIYKPGWGIRKVCDKCRDEMISVFGWEFGGRNGDDTRTEV